MSRSGGRLSRTRRDTALRLEFIKMACGHRAAAGRPAAGLGR